MSIESARRWLDESGQTTLEHEPAYRYLALALDVVEAAEYVRERLRKSWGIHYEGLNQALDAFEATESVRRVAIVAPDLFDVDDEDIS